MVRLYIIGLFILITAILANGIAVKIGIKSWYGFIELWMQEGGSVFSKISVGDILWLFIFYPLILGSGYWIGDKIYHLIFN